MSDDHVSPSLRWRETTIDLADGLTLSADVVEPATGAVGTILFAHGSGSSRKSPRNRMVAARLATAGLSAHLLDLLTPAEEADDLRTREHRFDIPKLAARFVATIDHLDRAAPTPVGCFGASTGAAAALIAAAERPGTVRAVVSRGGRPDLAGDALPAVRTPTLLIVGELDRQVLALNEAAAAAIVGPTHIAVIPGATHLFEEAGALDQVADLTRAWFVEHVPGDAT